MSSGNDKKFVFHQSIKALKKKIKVKSEFWSNFVCTETKKRITEDLAIKKASFGEIPTCLFKKCNFVSNTVRLCVNKALKMGSFHDSLKCANVRPIYNKEDPFDKKNYRPVSILPLLSKVYGRMIYAQASNYFEPFFNDNLCGFKKAHSTQHTLFN